MERLRDLFVLEFLNTINEGLCDRHLTQCPGATDNVQLQSECSHVIELAEEIRRDFLEVGKATLCRDQDEHCPEWVPSGSCESNAGAHSDDLVNLQVVGFLSVR